MKSLIFVFLVFTSLIAFGQEDNDSLNEYFDDGGITERKNTIFTDAIYLFQPFYTIGIQREFSKKFSVSAGLMFSKPNHQYYYIFIKFPFFPVDLDVESGASNLNYFIEFNKDIIKEKNKWNRLSFGAHYLTFQQTSIYDIYLSKTLYSFVYNYRFALALDFQLGLRLFDLNPSASVTNSVDKSKIYGSIYFHAPLKIGFRF